MARYIWLSAVHSSTLMPLIDRVHAYCLNVVLSRGFLGIGSHLKAKTKFLVPRVEEQSFQRLCKYINTTKANLHPAKELWETVTLCDESWRAALATACQGTSDGQPNLYL